MSELFSIHRIRILKGKDITLNNHTKDWVQVRYNQFGGNVRGWLYANTTGNIAISDAGHVRFEKDEDAFLFTLRFRYV